MTSRIDILLTYGSAEDRWRWMSSDDGGGGDSSWCLNLGNETLLTVSVNMACALLPPSLSPPQSQIIRKLSHRASCTLSTLSRIASANIIRIPGFESGRLVRTRFRLWRIDIFSSHRPTVMAYFRPDRISCCYHQDLPAVSSILKPTALG